MHHVLTCFIDGITPVSTTMGVFFICAFTRALPIGQLTISSSLVSTETEIRKL